MSENTEVVANDQPNPSKKRIGSKLILTLFFIALIFVSGLCGFGYWQLSQVNQSLLVSIVEMKQQAISSQQELSAMNHALTDVKQMAEAAKKQNENINWPVAEAFYLTKQANHYLQLTHDAQKAYVLLQAAVDLMQQAQGVNLDPIRQALMANVAGLQSAAPSKIEEVYLQMATIYNQLDNLPLQPAPLQSSTTEASTVQAAAQPEQKKDDSNLPWWKAQWNKTKDALGKVVIVKYTGATDLPLVMPEEKMFLYQNLHAQMESAMIGLLHQNPAVYQVSLARLNSWIKKYFVADAPLTTNILQQVSQLQAMNIQAPVVDLNSTLQLFDQYLTQNK